MIICFFSFSNFKKMDLQNKKVLTFAEGCEYLGYAKSYVYKLTSSAIIPFSKPNGKSIFFDREKLEAWMLSNASQSHAEREIDAATFENTKGGKAK
jgi:excisionase family DNA binding protein